MLNRIYIYQSPCNNKYSCTVHNSFVYFARFAEEGKKLHFISPARRKSVLAPILNKIKIGADGADLGEKKLGSESSGSGHIAVQIEPARRVKVSEILCS